MTFNDLLSYSSSIQIKNIIIKSFKELSYDKSNKLYLVQSEEMAVDFDAYKNAYNSNLKSDDALYIDKNNNIYLIEFKNGKLKDFISDFRRKNTNDLIEKNNDSVKILIDTKVISNINIISYIFVYNAKMYPDDTFKDRFDYVFSSKSNTLKKRLGLNIFDNTFKKSEVIDNVVFDKKFKQYN